MASNTPISKTAPGPTVASILSNTNSGTVNDAVNKVFQSSPLGPINSGITDNFIGLNHRQTLPPIPINKDFYGLTFFTRPLLNLSSVNLRDSRILTPLLTTEEKSIPRYIRCMLDRRLGVQGINSPLVDPQQAFIPLLTNFLISISGWPDLSVPTMTSPSGAYKEEFSMVDGITENYSTYDITASYRNLPGDPITSMFFYWAHYSSKVYEGSLVPYPEYIVENEIDYMTRIYRLVLDSTKSQVQKISASGVSFPVSAPVGASFDFDRERPINQSNDQISITFRCIGACHLDPILVYEFNNAVVLFNDSMKDATRANTNTLIPFSALNVFNTSKCYPRINPDTYALEWWTDNDNYKQLSPIYQSQIQNNLIQP